MFLLVILLSRLSFSLCMRCSCGLLWYTIYSTEKLLVVLRDGRKLLGILRSFDQFGRDVFPASTSFWHSSSLLFSVVTFPHICAANAVLEGASERVIVGDLYCDIPLGLYVIRGENVVLIGELVWCFWFTPCFSSHSRSIYLLTGILSYR